jgi:hypothetical protein
MTLGYPLVFEAVTPQQGRVRDFEWEAPSHHSTFTFAATPSSVEPETLPELSSV